MPRVNFVSFTFLFAFGLGSFVGIGLALLAVALATPEPEPTVIQPDPAALADVPPTATPTDTVTPTATASATPEPVIRTRSTLDVRIGPANGYAILGTLAAGSEISLEGRDDNADWLAINFPPGSSARGWIPAGEVDGVSNAQIRTLEVLEASLIETTPRFPFSTPPISSFDGPIETPTILASAPGPGATPSATPRLSPTPGLSPTPRVSPTAAIGPTDLAIAGAQLVSGGRIRIVVENVGPGAVPGVTVEVRAAGYAPERLSSGGTLRRGETATFQTDDLQLNASALVTIEVDPDGRLSDLDRSNNILRLELDP